jgi:nucleoside-diphosphate-sugar epimerase
MRVLVTGATGWTAISIIQTLSQARYEIIGFDLSKTRYSDDVAPLVSRTISGDISNFNQIETAVQSTNVNAIIHLAVAVGKDDYQKSDIPFAVNVKGTYNVFEAARKNAISKVILISSAAVHLPHKNRHICNALTDWKSGPNDDHLYDLTKRLQEEIAKDFCETFGMQAVVLRAGHIVDGQKRVDPKGRALVDLEYCQGGWVCRYDLARACLRALELNSTGYAAFHIIGAEQARQHFDIARTERELGPIIETRFEQYG